MKVYELIETLKTLPQDKSVLIVKGKTGYGISSIKEDAVFVTIST